MIAFVGIPISNELSITYFLSFNYFAKHILYYILSSPSILAWTWSINMKITQHKWHVRSIHESIYEDLNLQSVKIRKAKALGYFNKAFSDNSSEYRVSDLIELMNLMTFIVRTHKTHIFQFHSIYLYDRDVLMHYFP